MKRACAILALLLFAGTSAAAADGPPHIAGHLLAAYCIASPAEKLEHFTAIYREFIPVAAPPGSNSTVAFHGGYVGLAGNKVATGGSTIYFSIWSEDAAEVQPADKKYGTIKTRQLNHEGTAGRDGCPSSNEQLDHLAAGGQGIIRGFEPQALAATLTARAFSRHSASGWNACRGEAELPRQGPTKGVVRDLI